MSEKPREFYVYTGACDQTIHCVDVMQRGFNPDKHNAIHVIEYSAYKEKNRRLIETNGFLHDKHQENQILKKALEEAITGLEVYAMTNETFPEYNDVAKRALHKIRELRSKGSA